MKNEIFSMINTINIFDRNRIKKAYGNLYKKLRTVNESVDLEKEYVDAGGDADDFDIPQRPPDNSEIFEEWCDFLRDEGYESKDGSVSAIFDSMSIMMRYNEKTNQFDYSLSLLSSDGTPFRTIEGSIDYDKNSDLSTNLNTAIDEISDKGEAAKKGEISEGFTDDNDIADYMFPGFSQITGRNPNMDDYSFYFWNELRIGMRNNGITEREKQDEIIRQNADVLKKISDMASELETEFKMKLSSLEEEFEEKRLHLVSEAEHLLR